MVCVIDMCGNRKRKSTAFQKYISRREADCFLLTYPTQTPVLLPGPAYIVSGSCFTVIAVVQDLLDLVHLLQEHGAAKVVLGDILFRGKMQEGGPSLEIFKTNVTFINAKLWEKALAITGFRMWRHDGVSSALLLFDYGVHLTSHGMKRYWRSIRGALLFFSLHR